MINCDTSSPQQVACDIFHFDMKTKLVNGVLKEEVFMTQLKGFVKKGDDQIYGMQVF